MSKVIETLMAPPQSQPFRLLDLPVEIRAMIFSELLVVERTIHDKQRYEEGEEREMCVHIKNVPSTLLRLLINARRRSANVGCVIIDTLAPEKLEPLSTRRTPFLVTGWKSHEDWEMTTYVSGFGHDLRVLETNRQIYHEASIVYYSQNIFYAEGPSVLVPFLKDRGNRTRNLIRKLSIRYPSPAEETRTPFGADDYGMYDCVDGDLSMWADTCHYISLNMPGLAQLDLRGRNCSTVSKLELDDKPKTPQTTSDFPARQREVLATIGPGTKLTVSEPEWCRRDDFSGMRPTNFLFTPLQPWLRNQVSQLRVMNGLAGYAAPDLPSQARKANLESFWKKFLQGRSARSYKLIESEE